jgi:hypothetical protein
MIEMSSMQISEPILHLISFICHSSSHLFTFFLLTAFNLSLHMVGRINLNSVAISVANAILDCYKRTLHVTVRSTLGFRAQWQANSAIP